MSAMYLGRHGREDTRSLGGGGGGGGLGLLLAHSAFSLEVCLMGPLW